MWSVFDRVLVLSPCVDSVVDIEIAVSLAVAIERLSVAHVESMLKGPQLRSLTRPILSLPMPFCASGGVDL